MYHLCQQGNGRGVLVDDSVGTENTVIRVEEEERRGREDKSLTDFNLLLGGKVQRHPGSVGLHRPFERKLRPPRVLQLPLDPRGVVVTLMSLHNRLHGIGRTGNEDTPGGIT